MMVYGNHKTSVQSLPPAKPTQSNPFVGKYRTKTKASEALTIWLERDN